MLPPRAQPPKKTFPFQKQKQPAAVESEEAKKKRKREEEEANEIFAGMELDEPSESVKITPKRRKLSKCVPCENLIGASDW